MFLGSHQIAGRGRGTNNWLSPPGCLQFSILLRARKELGPQLVFLQYLFGLSVVEAVRNLPGYENLALHLKWPNDLYVNIGEDQGLRKIGGILVNSTYAGKDFSIIIGESFNCACHCIWLNLPGRLRHKHHELVSYSCPLRSHTEIQCYKRDAPACHLARTAACSNSSQV